MAGNPPPSGERYRVVSRDEILEQLVLASWPHEANARRKAEETLETLHRDGLPEGNYDPYEVSNLVKLAGGEAWEASLATGRRMIRDLAAGPSPRFRVTFRREFAVGELPRDRSLRLRLPAALDASTQDATVRAHVDGASAEIDTSVAGRVDVKIAAGAARGETIGVEMIVDLESRPETHDLGSGEHGPSALDEDSKRRYTAPREGLVVVSAGVKTTADRIAGGASDDVDALRRLWHFTAALDAGAVHYDLLRPSEPLESVLELGWADCRLSAALLVALCRARRIPARIVGGYTLYSAVPFLHYWAEAHLASHGWVPVDFLCVDLARGADGEDFRDLFLGSLERRWKVECFPLTFVGSIGLPIPADWFALRRLVESGVEQTFRSTAARTLLYRDVFSVTRLPTTAA